MNSDRSWPVGIHETIKMSSVQELPTRGSDVTVLITRVHLHPLCVLVEFWGKFSQEKTVEYENLVKDIQAPQNKFKEFEGSPGDQCLTRIDGVWFRSRIVSRNGSKYSVFLIDQGLTCSRTTSDLAWGKKEHFLLPPEVEFCVLANVLPLSPENRWSPVALEFLKSLSGESVKAHVQDVLVTQRTVFLHIPCISKQMYEMGFAKRLSPDTFHEFVLLSVKNEDEPQVSLDLQQISVEESERLHKQELYMHPELPAGTVETVVVTEVTNPQRIFCQLKVFSQELKKLSEQITLCCEGRVSNCIITPEMIGYPCAARGSDGRWYRSVLQQVFTVNRLVEVMNVDYGTKQFVHMDNIRPLAAEFFRMPVITYNCSLYGIIDKGVGWTTDQIDFLKNLLLHKTVIGKFEYQSISEGVHYITLYGDENTNINSLFGSKESCFLECERTLGDYAICNAAYRQQRSAQQGKNQRLLLTPGKDGKGDAETLPAEDLTLNSSHGAFVQHVSNPSEFWIQTQNYANELDEMMDSLYHLYADSQNKDVVINPTVGLYCVAKAEDGDFYRAVVSEVRETQIKVFFVDYGSAEVVDRMNIRILPDKFKKLPRLALKCSLSGVKPKDGRWSQNATELFIKAVTDKALKVHVTTKHDDGYVVQLTDPGAQGEGDLSSLMCGANFAEKVEAQRFIKPKITKQPPAVTPSQQVEARFLGARINRKMFLQTETTGGASISDKRIPTYREHMFPIGSVLDVTVSYIQSPNDFWCQLVQNAGHLKLLMHDIQARYAGSEYEPVSEMVCVARHPDNRMWYRALVIHKHDTPHVDVLFVDYGQTETVSLYDLRKIYPEFLALHGQAFRCSLLNPVEPMSAINEWNDEATAKFYQFVQTAASNFVILKCTIYAVMYRDQKTLFNIVDLETPFESVCTSMVQLVKSAPPKKSSGPSFRLDTYYYSTHNIKCGTEEQVTVTCVNNVGQFYCQLERNADIINDLRVKVNNLCHQLENVKLPAVFGTLCFAKYTDGHWYRGQIRATRPSILVHFVDYGDTIEVNKSNLLPVPREANDIMTVPVQAVVCGLSDIPTKVPTEVNSWFETSATESKYRALVVAREPDGKLLVELYHGNTQINAKIKRIFQIEMHREEQVIYRNQKSTEVSTKQKPSKPDEVKPAKTNLQLVQKVSRHVGENGQKVKAAPLKLYTPPHQRESHGRKPGQTENGSDPAGLHVKPKKQNVPTDTKWQMINTKPPGAESLKENDIDKLPTLSDLPLKSIPAGLETDVYVSYCSSPMSFFVQLVKEEDEIFSVAEKLNNPKPTQKPVAIKHLHPGHLVQAEFADDASWYRAVVREIHNNTMMVQVEFVDFGNTALTPVSKIGRLDESLLQLPAYSTHCKLSDAAEETLDPKVLSAFYEAVGGDGTKTLRCRFIRRSGSVWEVSLDDGGVKVTCKTPDTCSDENTEQTEKLTQNASSLRYQQQVFVEKQQLQVYITSVNDDHSFWCQCADTEELDKVTSAVTEVANAADHKPVDADALGPRSPCVVCFLDDQLWYRAEVVDKDADDLSVLFVDYGNKSRVCVTDVREIPPELIETPPQAFLCELDGFDSSCGCWEIGAEDELFTLTTEKLSQLTITRVTREEENIRYTVQVECDGQVINDVMKTRWKKFTTENKPGADDQTVSDKQSLEVDADSPNGDDHTDEVELRQEKDEESECNVAAGLQRDVSSEEETNQNKPKDILLSDSGIEETLLPPHGDQEGSSLISAEDADDIDKEEEEEEGDSVMMDTVSPESTAEDVKTCDMTQRHNVEIYSDPSNDRDDTETIVRNRPPTSVTAVKMVPREAVGPSQTSDPHETSSDSAKDEVQIQSELTLLPLAAAQQQLSDQQTEADDPDPEAPHVSTHVEFQNDSVTEEETFTHQEETFTHQEETFTHQEETFTHQEETFTHQEETFTHQEETFTHQEETFTHQEETFTHQEETFTHQEETFTHQEETFTHQEETFSDVLTDTDSSTREPRGCTAPSADVVGDGEDLISFTDVCSESVEVSVDCSVSSVTEDCLITVAAEETFRQEDFGSDENEDLQEITVRESHEIQSKSLGASSLSHIETLDISPQDEDDEDSCEADKLTTEDEASTLRDDEDDDQLSALTSDAKPQTCTDLRNLVEEVTCLVGEICLTDVCRDKQHQHHQVETDDGGEQEQTTRREDVNETDLSERTSSSADDSFDVQLGKITHLSLIVSNRSDALPAEQQSEE